MATKTPSRRAITWDASALKILRECYIAFDTTVDDIGADNSVKSSFNVMFAQKSGMSTSAEVVYRKLLNLRKKGEANGGLPKIRH